MASAASAYRDEYTGGEYGKKHPDWHMSEAPAKAEDLYPGLEAILRKLQTPVLRLADVGAGTGAVLDAILRKLSKSHSDLKVQATGFELAPDAIELATRHFPGLPMRQKPFEPGDGPFDVVMFVDVLEHVENPWELLRTARSESRFMLVRQPLLGGYSEFRHSNYAYQRNHWGHISYFNYRSFLDLADACGWQPLKVDLVAPWELATTPDGAGGTLIKRLLTRWDREWASFILSGFYLNGAFQ
ncbi:MAG: class I SAM-dependent methyltransferase [Phycisphaerae bacterium]|nr:class I SAM-dependent methyltransferase [Phycisphaerae bacterium]MDW8261483.1 class I SAM-dependent methyltransferase [Phycisphaerales bacterium]